MNAYFAMRITGFHILNRYTLLLHDSIRDYRAGIPQGVGGRDTFDITWYADKASIWVVLPGFGESEDFRRTKARDIFYDFG